VAAFANNPTNASTATAALRFLAHALKQLQHLQQQQQQQQQQQLEELQQLEQLVSVAVSAGLLGATLAAMQFHTADTEIQLLATQVSWVEWVSEWVLVYLREYVCVSEWYIVRMNMSVFACECVCV